MCSTGAATKLTVAPAIIPARPCPIVGSLLSTCWLMLSTLRLDVREMAKIDGLEKTLSFRIRR